MPDGDEVRYRLDRFERDIFAIRVEHKEVRVETLADIDQLKADLMKEIERMRQDLDRVWVQIDRFKTLIITLMALAASGLLGILVNVVLTLVTKSGR